MTQFTDPQHPHFWQGYYLIDRNLSGMDFSDANLKGASIVKIDLSGANLRNANLQMAGC